jgi:hypothetical protein
MKACPRMCGTVHLQVDQHGHVAPLLMLLMLLIPGSLLASGLVGDTFLTALVPNHAAPLPCRWGLHQMAARCCW